MSGMSGIDALLEGCTANSASQEAEVLLPLIDEEEKMQARPRGCSDTSTRAASIASSQDSEPKRRRIRPGGLAYEYDEADACCLQ
mmetsp:Transcript_83779/g.132800  ORF Transcript_83779/g.132800 Transcript_83779/m.132800 type:complete len:85 (-) Transcript_83779:97-351(-)